jgi:hypothetical protein
LYIRKCFTKSKCCCRDYNWGQIGVNLAPSKRRTHANERIAWVYGL